MLKWALIFFVIAVIAGIVGFTGIAGALTEAARTLFFVSLILMVVSSLIGAFRGRPPV
ncbi:MAG: DUF1328 domain-containing protein [Opitutus sp.]